MKKNKKYIALILLLFAVIYGCKKLDTEFRDFYDGHEIVYTGAVGQVNSYPGNLRVKLKWKASTDPSITKYIIYWNNKADSQIVNVTTKTDSISALVGGLDEYNYTFTIYSADDKGNHSVATEINNIKTYGPLYQSTLLNRAYNAERPFSISGTGVATLRFSTPDTINITTEIKYVTTNNETKTVYLSPDSNTVKLPGIKLGTQPIYRSSFIPEKASIDTFAVEEYSTFPIVDYRFVQCDKSLFAQTNNPRDAYADFGTAINKLWDGSVGPQSYPNIFHSNGSALPQQLTIDLGTTYDNLAQMEETGRDCCHNPDQFEVWGIADINGHDTSLPPGDAGWKQEAISKGWVLLKDVVRTDNGNDAYKFDIDNHGSPIRYIRLRIKHNANGEGSYWNMSELTFWNKE